MILFIIYIYSFVLNSYINAFQQQQQPYKIKSSFNYRLFSITNDNLINDIELIKLFGRLADKELLLDIPGAGTPEMMNCCHGGCSNCDYSRIFDSMSSGRPKWIPLYPTRQLIDGRSHISYWTTIFSSTTTTSDISTTTTFPLIDEIMITKSEFLAQLQQLPYRPSLGIPQSLSDNLKLQEETLDKFWNILMSHHIKTLDTSNFIDTTLKKHGITSLQMADSLRWITSQSHGATWADFQKGMTAL